MCRDDLPVTVSRQSPIQVVTMGLQLIMHWNIGLTGYIGQLTLTLVHSSLAQ